MTFAGVKLFTILTMVLRHFADALSHCPRTVAQNFIQLQPQPALVAIQAAVAGGEDLSWMRRFRMRETSRLSPSVARALVSMRSTMRSHGVAPCGELLFAAAKVSSSERFVACFLAVLALRSSFHLAISAAAASRLAFFWACSSQAFSSSCCSSGPA